MKRQDTSVAPLTASRLKPTPGMVCQVRRKIKAAVADSRQLLLKAIGEKAGTACQLNDPG